ncbi:MAG: nucleotidyltransferase family protein [Aggregatilineales bacterium]
MRTQLDVIDQPIPVFSRISAPPDQIAAFCQRWHIAELALFGSVLRNDFRPDSDVDVLATFEPGGGHTLSELTDLYAEIEALFGRPVDLIDRPSLERSPNYIRRKAILNSARVVYAARS